MSGNGFVRFCPDARPIWSVHTGVEALDNKELKAAYTRSHNFLVQKIGALSDDHGWDVEIVNDNATIAIVSPPEPLHKRLRIPKSFDSFLNTSEDANWTEVFQEHLLFPVTQPAEDSADLSIAGPPSLADIVYLLQCLAPGMLLLTSVDEIDEVGEAHIVRALPRRAWIQEHEEVLVKVLGSAERYRRLLEGETKGFEIEFISQDDESDWADDSEF